MSADVIDLAAAREARAEKRRALWSLLVFAGVVFAALMTTGPTK